MKNERLPIWYIASSSVYAVAGMAFGLYQHVAHDHKPVPLHSHLDSLGWLSMAVLGLIMDRYSWVREHNLAAAQFWTTQVGTLLMLGGLPLVYLHITSITVTLGAILVPVGYVLFAVIMMTGLRAQAR
jgi:hypothetical protein